VRLGEHIHDHSRLAVLEGMEDYGLSLRQHTTAKVRISERFSKYIWENPNVSIFEHLQRYNIH
jgi:hypothetical protein